MTNIKKLMLWDVDCSTKSQLFDQVGQLLVHQDLTAKPAEVISRFQQREDAGSTMIDELLAAPHAQTNDLNRNTLILARTKRPIRHWAVGEDAQNFIFCCIRKDIAKDTAHEVTYVLQQTVTDELIALFKENKQTEIEKILGFKEGNDYARNDSNVSN